MELIRIGWDHMVVDDNGPACPSCIRIVSSMLELTLNRSEEARISQLIPKLFELGSPHILFLFTHSHGKMRLRLSLTRTRRSLTQLVTLCFALIVKKILLLLDLGANEPKVPSGDFIL